MAEARNKTVLVVDDEPNVRQYLGSVLEDAGFDVLMAEDGEKALAMITYLQWLGTWDASDRREVAE